MSSNNPNKYFILGKRGFYSTWEKNQSIAVNEDSSSILSSIKRSRKSLKKSTIDQFKNNEIENGLSKKSNVYY